MLQPNFQAWQVQRPLFLEERCCYSAERLGNFVSLLVLILIALLQKWSNAATGALVGVGLPALGGFMVSITYLLLKPTNPIDMLAYDETVSPSMRTLEEATPILLSPYSQTTMAWNSQDETGRLHVQVHLR